MQTVSNMVVSIIGAKGKNNVIGLDNRLLWHLPDDLKYFKNKTSGHYVLMGRKTYLSLGKKLKDRKIIIVTQDNYFQVDNCVNVNSIESGLDYAARNGETELFVCGGEQIYRQFINKVDKLYLTQVDCELQGDRFFPDFQSAEWIIKNTFFHEKDSTHQYSFTINEYERITK
jgi:dihydrofolate reductase